jgi:hypothetical protein
MAQATKKIAESVTELTALLEKNAGTLTEAETGLLVSGFLLEQFGRTLRRFDYREPFAAAHPECAPTFTRTFIHADWTDGEDVVQAGATPGGDIGFNERFHRIESDLDALGADVRRTASCLAEMRRSLRVLLDEIRAQINQLHSDVHELSAARGQTTEPSRTPPFVGILDDSKFRGTILVGDKRASAWETAAGVIILPEVTRSFELRGTPDVFNNDAGVLGRYFADRPDIRLALEQEPLTRDQFLNRFGDDILPDGRRLRDTLEVLPADTPFASTDALLDVVARAEADRLRLLPDAADAIARSFNEGTEVGTVADAPLSEARFLSPQVRDALIAKGVRTVGEMAKLSTREIADVARGAQVPLTESEAATSAAAARFLVGLR